MTFTDSAYMFAERDM